MPRLRLYTPGCMAAMLQLRVLFLIDIGVDLTKCDSLLIKQLSES